MKKIVLILLLFSSAKLSYGQLWEFGMHLGYSLNTYTIPDNMLDDGLFLIQGSVFQGGEIGIQAILGESKDQPSSIFKAKKSLLLEASACYCGGTLGLSQLENNGDNRYTELTYVRYMAMVSPKFLLGLNQFQVFLGPVLMNSFYNAVTTPAIDGFKNASSQFSAFSVGYDFGIGVRSGSFLISGRTSGNITEFGKESAVIPGDFNLRQTRFVISYFIFEKNRDKNWKSLYLK